MNTRLKKTIRIIKNIFRRRVRYYQRKKEQLIIHNHSGMNELLSKREYYCSIKRDLIASINTYRLNHLNESIDMPTLQIRDFDFLSSNGDWLGKVFLYNGQIYRGINADSVNEFVKLWKTGILQALGENGILPVTTISNYYTENYPIILRHETVDINTSKSWCYEMIKDACIFACILRDVLEEFGYTLFDGHLNNIVFSKNKPLFVDIGSIVKNDTCRDGFSWELAFSGLYRLIFYLFGNNLLKHIQVYDESNNSIWMKPWHYDNALEEYYYYLKKFKLYGLLHNSIIVNYIIFKVFDCYIIKPEYIDILFVRKHKEFIRSNSSSSFSLNAVAPYFCEIHDVLGINLCSYKLIKKLSRAMDAKFKLIIDDDLIANQVYLQEKKEGGEIGVFLHNIMYSSDQYNLQNIKSDLVVVNGIESVSGFHSCKYDSLVSNLKKVTKKYLYITFNNPNEILVDELKRDFSVLFEYYDDMGNFNNRHIFCVSKEW